MAFDGFDGPQWPNHGGGILNRREAYYEKEISPKTVAKLKRKWQFLTKHNVTATPSVSLDGVVYFPSSDGYLYAVCATTGNVIWQKNLTKVTKSPITIFSRTTPVVTKDLLLVAIYGPALMLAMDRNTGDIVWSTLLDPNPLAVLTMSGTIYKSGLFVGTSSEEEGLGINSVDCCYFQGSFLKLDLITGDIKWRTLMIPDNHGNKHLYSGAAIWGSSPPIDIHRNLVIFATGNLYTTPPNITQCEQNQLKEKHPIVPDPCIKPSDHSESVLALDLENGTIIWSRHLGGYDTWNVNCVQPQNPNCPPIPGPDADFGEAPLLHSILDHSVHPHSKQDVAIVGQKNGFVWALDRNDGHIVWATVKFIINYNNICITS
jgi:outer membrane protein assembly factor BamB